ncbi:MAG: tetratricopeptide (TPR) repeat protein [Halocynthiibacter sp.]|jgi:tetratricopeptide (TPR) repeat protein
MKSLGPFLKRYLALMVITVGLFLPAPLLADKIDELFEALQTAKGRDLVRAEEEIWIEWSRSGSPAMDLLLKRGRDALEAGDPLRAIEHLSALIDHAPDFAEGYNARATAYFQSDDYGPALADIHMVLALNPRHFGALGGFAIILDEMGRERAALDVYRRLQGLHPSREGLAEAIARLERSLGDQEI